MDYIGEVFEGVPKPDFPCLQEYHSLDMTRGVVQVYIAVRQGHKALVVGMFVPLRTLSLGRGSVDVSAPIRVQTGDGEIEPSEFLTVHNVSPKEALALAYRNLETARSFLEH